MQVEVRPINLLGKARFAKDLGKVTPFRGELVIRENRVHSFGRTVTSANLHSTTDGLNTCLLPELIDCAVIWSKGNELRLRGNELIEGVLYGQTWDIKVLAC